MPRRKKDATYTESETDAMIRELHLIGMNNTEIADALGISRQAVEKKMKKLGLVSNRKKGQRGKAKCRRNTNIPLLLYFSNYVLHSRTQDEEEYEFIEGKRRLKPDPGGWRYIFKNRVEISLNDASSSDEADEKRKFLDSNDFLFCNKEDMLDKQIEAMNHYSQNRFRRGFNGSSIAHVWRDNRGIIDFHGLLFVAASIFALCLVTG